jgi:hypothetical protein
MANKIATVALYGDPHLSDKNYGAHRDYAKESITYYSEVTKVVKERNVTHLIGLGDFSFGRFKDLAYREKVERELQIQYEVTHGNHYELCGNHDVAGYGMCERDFYINRGLLKKSENITLGNLHITMVDYGKYNEVVPNIVNDESSVNLIASHDYFKFNDTKLPKYGTPVILDTFERWYGADLLVCGHIHKILDFSGNIIKDSLCKPLDVSYLGCMTRPAYKEGNMDDIGQVMVLDVYDDGNIDINKVTIPLWSLAESFNLELKAKEKAKEQEKANRVDLTDIVKQLDSHERNVGNPEDIISSMEGIADKYKNKAIDLLKSALA